MGLSAFKSIIVEFDQDDFLILKMNHTDIQRMFVIFQKIDYESKGGINMDALLKFLNLKSSPFCRKMYFLDFDDIVMNFKSFVYYTWNFCTLSEHQIINLAFSLYDENSNGVIDFDEAIILINDLNGSNYRNITERSIITTEMAYELCSGTFTRRMLRTFFKKHTAILSPILGLQSALLQKTIGVERWSAYAASRPTVCSSDLKDMILFIGTQNFANRSSRVVCQVVPRPDLKFKKKIRRRSAFAISPAFWESEAATNTLVNNNINRDSSYSNNYHSNNNSVRHRQDTTTALASQRSTTHAGRHGNNDDEDGDATDLNTAVIITNNKLHNSTISTFSAVSPTVGVAASVATPFSPRAQRRRSSNDISRFRETL